METEAALKPGQMLVYDITSPSGIMMSLHLWSHHNKQLHSSSLLPLFHFHWNASFIFKAPNSSPGAPLSSPAHVFFLFFSWLQKDKCNFIPRTDFMYCKTVRETDFGWDWEQQGEVAVFIIQIEGQLWNFHFWICFERHQGFRDGVQSLCEKKKSTGCYGKSKSLWCDLVQC